MKAVVYHADARFAWGGEVGGFYKRLFPLFMEQCHKHGMEVVHLTLEGFPGWGDSNIYYGDLKPEDVVYNREQVFAEFLEGAREDVYWFCEPDTVILKMWPPLTTDCAFLYRHGDAVAMTPGWRMARPSAAPIYREIAEIIKTVEVRPGVGRDWHSDSEAFTKMWRNMGKPMVGKCVYKGLGVEMREYRDYIKPGVYSKNYNGPSKKKLLSDGFG